MLTERVEPLDEVFILGAGFSTAISSEMPLTDELGNLLLRIDDLGRSDSHIEFADGSFETWLSRRAESQPYLSEAENLANRAIFARGAAAMAQVLDDRVASALTQPIPAWLGELLSVWHLRESNVLTFNYDPLVECAFETLHLYDWRTQSSFQWGSLINYSPRGTAGSSYGEVDGTLPPHPSVRLWKLHGSLNWHWVAGDTSGATVMRARLPGTFGEPRPVTADDLHWIVPGRGRFMVPPAMLKAAHYRNPVTREIWNRAYAALAAARTITFMGYSLPQADVSTSGMLTEALTRGNCEEIRIVDLAPGDPQSPASIPGRIHALGFPHATVTCRGSGYGAIPDYVRSLVTEAAASAVEALRAYSGGDEPSLLADWGEIGGSAAVVGISSESRDGLVILETEHLAPMNATTTRRPDGAPVLPMTLATLRDHLAGATAVALNVPGVERRV